MIVRTHNPPREQGLWPHARRIFCGVFKKAKGCQQGNPRRSNPAEEAVEVVRYTITSSPRRNPCTSCKKNPCGCALANPKTNPESNPCSTCGLGVPPNPPGNASSRERRAWAMSQIGRPMVNPGPCPECGREHNRAPNPVNIPAISHANQGTPAWGPGAGAGQAMTTSRPLSAAQMLGGRRQRRQAKLQLGMQGALATPERIRNCDVGPTALALSAVNFVPGRGYEGNPRHSAREANARNWSTYWSTGGPWQYRTPSTPALGPQGGAGWTGPAPWSYYPYARDAARQPYPAVVNPTVPAHNPGWLAVGLSALGGTIVGGILGSGGAAYAMCQPRQIHNFGLTADRQLQLQVVMFPCIEIPSAPRGRTGKMWEITVTEAFQGEPDLSFGPQGFDDYNAAIAWASEQSNFDWAKVLQEGGTAGETPPGGVSGEVPTQHNPGAYAAPSYAAVRAPKHRNRNPNVAAVRARLGNPPAVFPGPGAHSKFAPLPPQWFYYQGASTAGAPAAPGVPVASPGPPPGVFGQGAVCYNDRDCRDNEYCHGGLCVPDPWEGGASRQRPASNPAQIQRMSVPLAPGVAA